MELFFVLCSCHDKWWGEEGEVLAEIVFSTRPIRIERLRLDLVGLARVSSLS